MKIESYSSDLSFVLPAAKEQWSNTLYQFKLIHFLFYLLSFLEQKKSKKKIQLKQTPVGTTLKKKLFQQTEQKLLLQFIQPQRTLIDANSTATNEQVAPSSEDLLPREPCLQALAALRHAKWFQVCVFKSTSSILHKILLLYGF